MIAPVGEKGDKGFPCAISKVFRNGLVRQGAEGFGSAVSRSRWVKHASACLQGPILYDLAMAKGMHSNHGRSTMITAKAMHMHAIWRSLNRQIKKAIHK